jgi:hypothetical protein
MSGLLLDHPVLNSPYLRPSRHWQLDDEGQPTQRVDNSRWRAQFITPILKPKNRKSAAQGQMVFDEGKGLSDDEQQYETISIITSFAKPWANDVSFPSKSVASPKYRWRQSDRAERTWTRSFGRPIESSSVARFAGCLYGSPTTRRGATYRFIEL